MGIAEKTGIQRVSMRWHAPIDYIVVIKRLIFVYIAKFNAKQRSKGKIFYSHHLALLRDDVRLETDKSFADLSVPVTMKVKTNLKIPRRMDADQHVLAFEIASHSAPAGATARVTGRTKDVTNVGNEPSA
jgi:hypothetical protein